ncbi:tetratricopeptide repeat protein [Undibacter mobilis]|uniref:Tetratricopeptide repeat protein n=1 Tax=Undibacter mobilis TaxID=2292256 RepID=A0A371B8F6_9BRAD|nr:tetratricopeptide repeat protein [Undibacter mobilis]RDV03850.1 tetratricopeptide repeat protein [Undibacter mobilis]
MRSNSSDGRTRPAALSEALHNARHALETGRPADAERIAAEILQANAGDREAAKVLGYALMMLGRNAEAVAVLEKASRGNRDAEADTAFGIALRQAGRGDEAVTAFNRAIKRDAKYPMAFYELGKTFAERGRIDEAIAVFSRGIAVAPTMIDMMARLGKCHLAAGDRKNARRCFERVLGLAPGHYATAEALAMVLMDDRDYAQAAVLFRAMVTANPDNAQARLGLANCMLHLGKDDAAYENMRAAAERGPKFYGQALRLAVTAQRGRFWLRPSDAEKAIKNRR